MCKVHKKDECAFRQIVCLAFFDRESLLAGIKRRLCRDRMYRKADGTRALEVVRSRVEWQTSEVQSVTKAQFSVSEGFNHSYAGYLKSLCGLCR